MCKLIVSWIPPGWLCCLPGWYIFVLMFRFYRLKSILCCRSSKYEVIFFCSDGYLLPEWKYPMPKQYFLERFHGFFDKNTAWISKITFRAVICLSYKIESYASNEHFYCFGANRIKIAKSVQKTSKSSIFCTDFIIFSILAKISSYKRSKSTVFVFF